MIVDAMDFDALPKIEKFYKTPAQLRKNENYDQEVVESLVNAVAARKTLQGSNQDSVSEFIEIYEVHGELPIALLKKEPKDKDWTDYRQQIHVVSYVQNKEGKYDDFSLYKGKEARDPQMLTHLIEEEGRTKSIGAVESLFDAQWMQNHTMKNIKNFIDLFSKIFFLNPAENYVNKNVLTAIETGDILIHSVNSPLTQVNNPKQDIVALQNFSNQWKVLAQELTATPDAMRGMNPPSGTPYSTTALLTSQSNSLFELMTENKGLHLEDMLRTYVIPHLKKKLKNKDQIVAILDSAGIQEIDAMYIPNAAIKRFNNRAKEDILTGQIPSPFDMGAEQEAIKQGLSTLGNKRFFKPDAMDEKTWADVFSDFNWDNIRVEITGEGADKQAVMQTLSSVFQTIASNPAILQDPNAKMVFSQILAETGRISPLQLSSVTAQPSTMNPAIPPPMAEMK